MILRMACLVGAIWMLWSLPAQAACSGSGTSWSCPSGTTSSEVNTVIGSANDGATVTFANGSYSWGGTRISPSLTKGITFICATGATCTVSSSGTTFDLPSGTSSKLYRISGFVFNVSSYVLWSCPGGGCTGTISQFRLDHNTINAGAQSIVQFGENTARQYIYGVADHNKVNCTQSCIFLNWINAVDNAPPAPPLGTVNNFFVEDNVITIAALTNLGTGCMDSWGQSAIVWRHNTSNNCRVISHGVSHAGGPSNIEIYNNSIKETDSNGLGCYRCVHHQGSNTFLVFNNQLTTTGAKTDDPMAFLHYRSFPNAIDGGDVQCDGTVPKDGNRASTATYRGYPCWRQPGRDVTGAYKPIYSWNNKWSDTGARIDLNYDGGGGSPDYSSNQIVADREYYNAVSINAQTSSSSPFDGSTGMGFGTLANRPLTCTTSSETAFGGAAGVGYFAIDQGTQGTLYTCSAINTWTVYYVPYTYPHPLEAGATPPSQGGGNPPAPPTGLTGVVQ
jgi:hypothetical protein